MPGRIDPDDETQIVANILRHLRRATSYAIAQAPQAAKDAFTVAATPATTYTLTTLPLASSVNLSLRGLELNELGGDYSVDTSTGVVTVAATLTSGDVLTADYWTTGDLIAASEPVDFGHILDDTFDRPDSATDVNPASDGGTWTVDSGTWGITSGEGALQSVPPTGTRWGNGMPTIRRDAGVTAVTVQVDYRSSTGTIGYAQILLGMDPTLGLAYYARLDSSTVAVLRCSGHTPSSLLDSASFTWGTSSHTLKFSYDGAGGLEFSVDGVAVVTVSDSWAVTLGTEVGLSGDVTDFFDNFSAS